MKILSHTTAQPPSLFRNGVAVVVTTALFGLALMFSVLLFAVILTAGALAWGYLWWKTRGLRRQLRMHPPGGVVIGGEVIEGEVIHVDPGNER
jgi:hypothetical protein